MNGLGVHSTIIDLVQQNPNFIFPSVKRELNPAVIKASTTNDIAQDIEDQASSTTHKSHLLSLRSFMRAHPTPTHAHAQADPETSHDHPHPPGRSISGPSLYTFERRSPDWSITESDVYRNASSIPHPLIEHPDLEKFRRPEEWGEKTPDLIEAEAISKQMRGMARLRQERLGKLPELRRDEEETVTRNREEDDRSEG